MGIGIIVGIHHVAVVVRDPGAAERFYVDVLGLQRHPKIDAWLLLNASSTLHLIPAPPAAVDEAPPRWLQHFALQVAELEPVLVRLLKHGHTPFQSDFAGNARKLTAADDPLDFGTGTLFVRDPDGNLIEFVHIGRGIF